ncbi:homoserine O-acetyltransferase/O-succinyltransferase family protein [Rhodopila sp.]|uniref:homoserine O-acetyltransferase/O-succinyltransferase family protein n=1 Tax=Rhodopila sp. TaxID=2480087 RepID=UPI003D0BF579
MLAFGSDDRPPGDLVIGLVNNMPPAARRVTEQQFAGLLTAASDALDMRISLFIVDQLASHTDDAFSVLQQAKPDGLIVTGAEPRHDAMIDEPVWPVLARLVDWAGEHTISTVWSCLAAHAAVFRLDQISRRRLPQKLSGVFACMKVADHPLLEEAPLVWPVPHSRYNSLDEAELCDKGYTVLSHAPRVGADSFVKQSGASLFLMLQGHAEYASESLLSEYRRDIRRFLAGQRAAYPEIPEGYLDQDVVSGLTTLREQACRTPNLDLLASFGAAITVAPCQFWYPYAVRLYASWLCYLAEQKVVREQSATWPARHWRVAS